MERLNYRNRVRQKDEGDESLVTHYIVALAEGISINPTHMHRRTHGVVQQRSTSRLIRHSQEIYTNADPSTSTETVPERRELANTPARAIRILPTEPAVRYLQIVPVIGERQVLGYDRLLTQLVEQLADHALRYYQNERVQLWVMEW